jgi:hypothetical protein
MPPVTMTLREPKSVHGWVPSRDNSQPDLAVLLGVAVGLGVLGGDGLDEIGPAHDADQLAVAHDRHTLDAMLLEQRRDLAERCFLAGRDDVGRHHLGHPPAMRLGELLRQRRSRRQRFHPPGPALLGPDLLAPNEVALADDAHDAAVGVDDRQRTDVVLGQQLDRLLHVGIGADRDHIANHNVDCFHGYLRLLGRRAGCRRRADPLS